MVEYSVAAIVPCLDERFEASAGVDGLWEAYPEADKLPREAELDAVHTVTQQSAVEVEQEPAVGS